MASIKKSAANDGAESKVEKAQTTGAVVEEGKTGAEESEVKPVDTQEDKAADE